MLLKNRRVGMKVGGPLQYLIEYKLHEIFLKSH